MNWKKITEQVVTVVLSMVLTAVGGGIVWGLTTILQHERTIANGGAEIKILKNELRLARERDKELVSLMAEEIKKLQATLKAAAMEKDNEKPMLKPADLIPVPQPIPPPPKEKDPEKEKIQDKFFPKEQKVDEYKRILRDKFNQRTDQLQQQMQAPVAPPAR
jgi:hypothetical protein